MKNTKRTIVYFGAIAAAVMLVADITMIFWIRRAYFRQKIAQVNCGRPSARPIAQLVAIAIGVYAIMVALLICSRASPTRAAILGFIAYAMFDGTLLLMSDAWTLADASVDLAWGTALFAGSVAASRAITKTIAGTDPEKIPSAEWPI